MSDLKSFIFSSVGAKDDTWRALSSRFYDPTCATDVLVTAVAAPGAGRRLIVGAVVATKEVGGGATNLFLAQDNSEFLGLGFGEGKPGILSFPIPLSENTALRYRLETPSNSKISFFYTTQQL
jgi:hypothetical protein